MHRARMKRYPWSAAAPCSAPRGAAWFSSKFADGRPSAKSRTANFERSKFADGRSNFAGARVGDKDKLWVSDRDKRTTTARGVPKLHVLEGELLYGTGRNERL